MEECQNGFSDINERKVSEPVVPVQEYIDDLSELSDLFKECIPYIPKEKEPLKNKLQTIADSLIFSEEEMKDLIEILQQVEEK